MMTNKELILANLMRAMIKYDGGDAPRIQHFVKVHDFARMIAIAEGMTGEDLFVLEAAAILHDVGIHVSEARYGNCDGKHQEELGPDEARKVLSEVDGFTAAQIERICWLIAHHHTYQDVTSLDHRILLEADFLVNSFEAHLAPEGIITFRDHVFRSESAIRMLNDMWGPGLTRSPEQQRIVAELTPDEADTVLVKWRYSAFHRSPLEQMLKETGRNQLLITGVYAHIGCMTTATDAFMRDIKPFFIADALADFTRDEHLMSLKYVAGRSGRVVMTDELLPSVPATKAALRELILPLLDESDEPMDDENLIDYGLDSVRMMALAARWRKVHGDIDFVMLAKNPTLDAWWALLSREVK